MEEFKKDIVQETIYIQLMALKKLQKALQADEFTMPETVIHARRRLARLFLSSGKKPLVGLNDWAITMLQPVKEWLPEAEFLLDPDAPLWEEDGWSRDAEDFMQAYGKPEDYQEQTVAKVVEYCRQYQDQQGYVLFRSFLSDPDRAVVSEEQLNQMAASFSDEFLKQQIRACYEPFTEWNRGRKCPNCGWSLTMKSGAWRCGRANVCGKLEEVFKWSLQTAELFPFKKRTHIYRLRPGIHRYTLVPGIPEKRIADHLAKTHQIERYPDQDHFDISIQQDNQKIYLDVKCFRRPTHLATYIEQLGEERLEPFRNVAYFVVPDEYVYVQNRYIDQVNNRIEHLGVTVYQEKELYQLLKKGAEV
ncbi:restriction endonuclease-related protein [Kroppenstedtia sanguinis]|uniref:REase associating with pPIWI RE domain-containing protein n=1 Tax=Kroppenstedtia sanguinis TaxID=1380684 RepID=A0ABW4C5A5_9BACL